MKNERRFCRCTHCGNFISFIEDSGVGIICCGEEMLDVNPNTSDGAKEKHVPVVTREGDKLTVTVGEVPHPMTEEHHIAWIIAAEKNKTQRAALDATASPSAEFIVGGGSVTVYSYCNLHGLWAAELQ